tara:strand:+ start:372 stop:929 length:558 start_codon:yes stop_codon:yes gene_type:complete
MKKIKILFILANLILLNSCNFSNSKKPEIIEIKKNNKPEIKIEEMKVDGYLGNYFKIKNFLVNDDSKNSYEALFEFEKSIKSIETVKFTDVDQSQIKSIINNILNNVDRMKSESIKIQRLYFEKLSQNIFNLINIIDPKIKVFHQYCPMFNKNKGGMWLSSSKEIFNPLFGSSMLKCGYVKSEIN